MTMHPIKIRLSPIASVRLRWLLNHLSIDAHELLIDYRQIHLSGKGPKPSPKVTAANILLDLACLHVMSKLCPGDTSEASEELITCARLTLAPTPITTGHNTETFNTDNEEFTLKLRPEQLHRLTTIASQLSERSFRSLSKKNPKRKAGRPLKDVQRAYAIRLIEIAISRVSTWMNNGKGVSIFTPPPSTPRQPKDAESALREALQAHHTQADEPKPMPTHYEDPRS